MGNQPLVVDGAFVRARRHRVGGGALRPLPLAAPGTSRARLASPCGSLTLAELGPGRPLRSGGGNCRSGASARRARPRLVPVSGQQCLGGRAGLAERPAQVVSCCCRPKWLGQVDTRTPGGRPPVSDAGHGAAARRSRARCTGGHIHDLPEAGEPGAGGSCTRRRGLGTAADAAAGCGSLARPGRARRFRGARDGRALRRRGSRSPLAWHANRVCSSPTRRRR